MGVEDAVAGAALQGVARHERVWVGEGVLRADEMLVASTPATRAPKLPIKRVGYSGCRLEDIVESLDRFESDLGVQLLEDGHQASLAVVYGRGDR